MRILSNDLISHNSQDVVDLIDKSPKYYIHLTCRINIPNVNLVCRHPGASCGEAILILSSWQTEISKTFKGP